MIYYLLEQCVKLWAYGGRRYLSDLANLFDGLVTLTLVVSQQSFLLISLLDLYTNSKLLKALYLFVCTYLMPFGLNSRPVYLLRSSMFLILMVTNLFQPSLPHGTGGLNLASVIHQCSLLTTHIILVRTKWLYPSNATSP